MMKKKMMKPIFFFYVPFLLTSPFPSLYSSIFLNFLPGLFSIASAFIFPSTSTFIFIFIFIFAFIFIFIFIFTFISIFAFHST